MCHDCPPTTSYLNQPPPFVYAGTACPVCNLPAAAMTSRTDSRTTGNYVVTTYWHGTHGCSTETKAGW